MCVCVFLKKRKREGDGEKVSEGEEVDIRMTDRQVCEEQRKRQKELVCVLRCDYAALLD